MNFTPLNPIDCAPRSDSCLARSCSRGSLTRSNRFACGDDEPQLRSQPSRPVGHRGIDRRDWLASSYIQYRKEGGSCREPETQRKRAAIAGTFRWGRERADRGISGPQRTWSADSVQARVCATAPKSPGAGTSRSRRTWRCWSQHRQRASFKAMRPKNAQARSGRRPDFVG